VSPDSQRDLPEPSAKGKSEHASGPWVLDHVPNEVAAADFEMFRDILRGHYYPAKVEPLDGPGLLNAPRLSAIELDHLTIGHVRFGTAVSIDAGDLLTYHVDVPLSGVVVSRCGTQEIVATPRRAAVYSPRRHTLVPDWSADAAQLLIKLDRRSVEHELEGLLGRPVADPIQFSMSMPIAEGPGRAWLSTLAGLLDFLKEGSALGPVAARHSELLARTLISGLLLSQPHSYSEALYDHAGTVRGDSSVDRVVDVIKASPECTYSLADLCRIASLSARGLQAQFQRRFGMSPMQFLQNERLDRARESLCEDRGSVSDVAYAWGFSNLGRFARAYRRRFGELPSATRDRATRGGA
jgi:AraC-like DNA-binding protein